MSEIRADKLHNASGDNDSGIDLSTNDQVTIKTADTTRVLVDASGNVGIGATTIDSDIHLEKSSDLEIKLERTGSGTSTIGVPSSGKLLINNTSNADMVLSTNNTDRLTIGNDGSSILSGGGGSDYTLRIDNNRNSNDGYGLHISAGANDPAGTHYQIDFADGDGTLQGSISSNNGTVTYGAFTAFHPCIIPNADNDADSVANAYPYGTLLEITSLSYTQKNGADTERGILYNVQKSSSAKSKAVLGAYGSSMNSEVRGSTNLHQALVLGDGHILCNNENGNIAVGDYICTSSTTGEGMKATSICATIGIAREAITFTDSTAVLVAVEYGYRQFIPEDIEARITALENA